MTPTTAQLIQDNYTTGSIADRIKLALTKAGLGTGRLQWSDLTPFDQFHVRGLDATKEMADALELRAGQSVLDVGSGLGGPARYLAAIYGVHVTGIDLTPDFIEVSNYLSLRADLQDKLTFRHGDATELPFQDESFDVAWTQHVAMNIQDKSKLYGSIHRVLKTEGRLAIYDAVRGNDLPLIYPTPWARTAGISFVVTEDEMKQALAGAGFQIQSVFDKTEIAVQWFEKMQQQRQQQSVQQPPDPLSPVLILGPEMGPAIANFAQNVFEGRVRLIQIIAENSRKQ